MKILVVHNEYQQYGGERVAVEAQVRLLKEHGHTIIEYLRDNQEINSYRLSQKGLFFLRTIDSPQTRRDLEALVARSKPDLAHVHNVFPLISPSAYTALHRLGVPVVQTIHNFRFLCPNGLFFTHGQICERCKFGRTYHAVPLKCFRNSYTLSFLYALAIGFHRRRGTFQKIDRMIALNEFVIHKLVESGITERSKIEILGNFLPDPLPAARDDEQPGAYVVYLGRLSAEKGVENLIQAMSAVRNLGLKILGDGPLGKELQARRQQMALENIEFLGHIGGDHKWDILRRALATIIPSIWYEQLPFALLESWAVGTPVIVSDRGSLPFLVEDGTNGLVFHDPNDLAHKLSWLAAHPEMSIRMGQNGRRLVEEKYSAGAHYDRLMKIYTGIS